MRMKLTRKFKKSSKERSSCQKKKTKKITSFERVKRTKERKKSFNKLREKAGEEKARELIFSHLPQVILVY